MLLGLRQRRRLPDSTLDLTLGVVGLVVRNRLVRRVGNLPEQLVPPRLGSRQLPFEAAKLLLDLLQLLDLLGGRLALQLLATAQVVDLRDELAPAQVGLEQLVERLPASLSRDAGPHGLRVAARSPEVDQLCVRNATRLFRSCSLSWSYAGMTPSGNPSST